MIKIFAWIFLFLGIISGGLLLDGPYMSVEPMGRGQEFSLFGCLVLSAVMFVLGSRTVQSLLQKSRLPSEPDNQPLVRIKYRTGPGK